MTGVYEHALGERAAGLHPKVRARYGIGPDDAVCVGRGRMDISRGTHVLPMLYAMTREDLLFPEAGHDVPFTVTTAGLWAGGHEALVTRREFSFGRTRRRFDSLTVWDAERARLFDVLGKRGHIVSELHPRVEAGALVVEAGRQWLRVDDRYVPLPGPFAVSVEVRDRYDETDERYHVTAVVENALAGHVLSYRGSFTQDLSAVESVPTELHPAHEVTALPPT
jgi:hypothetical protein